MDVRTQELSEERFAEIMLREGWADLESLEQQDPGEESYGSEPWYDSPFFDEHSCSSETPGDCEAHRAEALAEYQLDRAK